MQSSSVMVIDNKEQRLDIRSFASTFYFTIIRLLVSSDTENLFSTVPTQMVNSCTKDESMLGIPMGPRGPMRIPWDGNH